MYQYHSPVIWSAFQQNSQKLNALSSVEFKAKSSWKGETWCWACGSQFLNVWMNWIIYLQRISELFKWRWLYLITLHAMWWDAALDSFSLSTFDWILCSLILETIDFRFSSCNRYFEKYFLLFHVVTWLSKINVKCQRQQWGVSLYQINHHYVRKMEQRRLSVNSWTSKIWVMASKMLGNNALWQLVTPWLRTIVNKWYKFCKDAV